MENRFYKIATYKGEMALYVLLFFTWLFIGIAIYPYGIIWNLVLLLAILGAVFILKFTGNSFLNKKYYVQADETGIAYNIGIFSKETKLIWELVKDIDVLIHEINFRLESDGTVNSLALSGLEEKDRKDLKKFIYKSFHAFKGLPHKA